MRIGFDGRSLDSPAGGVRRYARELLQALVRVNPGDTIIVFGASTETILPQAVRRHSVRQIAPTNLGWSVVDLPRAARRESLDIFHAPAYTAPLGGVRPLVLTIHDVSYERHPEWYPYRRDPFRRWFYRKSAHTADLIITDSEFSRQEISTAYHIDPQHISVVPLGVGAPFANSIPAVPPHDINETYLLHVGDLHPRRNVRLVIRALARLPSIIDRITVPQLVLVGVDRGERSNIEVEARDAGVRIHFAGLTDDRTLASLYGGAAAFVYPSKYEGFGLPLLEAMACGAPIVAARAGAIPEIVGDAGLLVDPEDESEMAARVVRLLTDSAFASRLREAGRRRARGYTWDRTAMLTTEAYGATVRRAHLQPDHRKSDASA